MADTSSKTSLTLDGLGAETLTLPQGTQVADMAILRSGQDLILRDDGQEIVVENYFLAEPQPDLLSDSGSRLSPDLVQSFVIHDGPVMMASPLTMSDVSPVGEITELEGAGTITRTDGTIESLSLGMPVFEGDILETAENGAANITFIDESSFAISDNARMAIDEFVFDPSSESGVTDVSLLKGVFLFTSGLIGRENPDAVEIETPVGSIGIRGTIIGGDIKPSGEESQISVIEGAIVVRNATGESILSEQFETVRVNDFNATIQEIGVLDAQDIAGDYGAVKGVSASLFSSINDIIRETGQNNDQTQDDQTSEAEAAATTEAQEAVQETEQAPTEDNAAEPKAEAAEESQSEDVQSEEPTQNTDDAPEASLDTVQERMQDETTRLKQGEFKELKARMMAEPAQEQQAETTELRDMGILDLNDVKESLKESESRAPVQQQAGPLEFKTDNDIDENSASGTVVGRVGPDSPVNFNIRYALIDDADGYFSINPQTGQVFVTPLGASNIDFEAKDSYDIVVRATRTSDGQFRDTPLTIDVNDVNDAPSLSVGTPGITEGASLTLTAAMVNGTDQDGDALTYTVGSLSGGITVEVDGVVKNTFTHAELARGDVEIIHDGSEGATASLSIEASDGVAFSAPQTLNLGVTNVNDNPTLTLNATSVNEGASLVLTNTMVTGLDADGDALTYTVANAVNVTLVVDGSPASSFTQDDLAKGKVRLIHDGSEGNTASIDINATDGHHTTTFQKLSLSVTPTNDAPTLTVTDPYMTEGTPLPLTGAMMTGADVDDTNANLTFTASNLANGHIEVNGVIQNTFTNQDLIDGDVVFVDDGSRLDGSFDIVLSDDDGATSATRGFSISVTVANQAITSVAFDPTPVESGMDIVMQLNSASQSVGSFTIDDPDQSSGFQYRVLDSNGNVDNRFEVVEVNGKAEMRLKSNIGLNTVQDIELTLEVTDAGGNVHDSTDITLAVRGDAITLSNATSDIAVNTGSAQAQPAYVDIGDFDLDGYSDRASFDAAANNGNGRITFEYGHSDGSYVPGEGFNGYASRPYDGTIVNIGDVNGRGAVDIAFGSKTSYGNSGSIQIIATSMSVLTINSTVANAQFGANIAALGDVNGNGFADILVSAPGEDAAYILYGADWVLDRARDQTLNNYQRTRIHDGGDAETEITGISAAGDFNGDGLSDFVVTLADTDASSGLTANIAYVVYGNLSMHTRVDINLHDLTDDADKAFKIFMMPEETGNSDNITVKSLGDVNGDGFDDIEITAHNADADGERYTIYGGNVTDDALMVTTSAAANIHQKSLIGNHQNNVLDDGGQDKVSLKGAQGDDQIIINSTDFLMLDGGQGHDMLDINVDNFQSVFGTHFVDLRDAIGRFSGFETIKMTGYDRDLKIFMSDVLSLLQDSGNNRLVFDDAGSSNAVVFYDNIGNGDTTLVDEGFVHQGQVSHNGEMYERFLQTGTNYEVLLDTALESAAQGGA